MIIEIMGPRNAGKTTLMDAVTQRDRDVAYFSLGAATRREIAMDSPAGRDMLMYMRKGAYPPGYLVQYVSEQLNGIKQEKVGVDGIPRQSYEVNDFRAIVKNTCRDCVGIAEISAQKHILLDRSRHRVYCPVCNLHIAGDVGAKCPRCVDSYLHKRDEDDPDKVSMSIDQYAARKDLLILGLREAFPNARTIFIDTSDQQPLQAAPLLQYFFKHL